MQVGDKVRVKNSSTVEGLIGTVVALRSANKHTVGVEFSSEVPDGHDCNGYGEDGYCRWLSPRQLVSARFINTGRGAVRKGGVMVKLNTFIKKLVDADVQVLIRHGWLDETLSPTPEGIDYLVGKLFLENRKELAKDARAEIREERSSRKGEFPEEE